MSAGPMLPGDAAAEPLMPTTTNRSYAGTPAARTVAAGPANGTRRRPRTNPDAAPIAAE
jgi:hypothetical protein